MIIKMKDLEDCELWKQLNGDSMNVYDDKKSRKALKINCTNFFHV